MLKMLWLTMMHWIGREGEIEKNINCTHVSLPIFLKEVTEILYISRLKNKV